MKKSHKWEERPVVDIRCPHCGEWFSLEGDYVEGDTVNCPKKYCLKDFKLGRQK